MVGFVFRISVLYCFNIEVTYFQLYLTCVDIINFSFNAVDSTKRDMTQLLNQWKNMKTKAKKSEFSYRRARSMTVGGPPPPRPPPEDQELIDAIPHEFSIDSNCHDSDSIYIKQVVIFI